MERKQNEMLKQALRQKREEDIENARRNAAQEKLLEKIERRNLKETARLQQAEELKQQKLYDKMLAQVEADLNDEVR